MSDKSRFFISLSENIGINQCCSLIFYNGLKVQRHNIKGADRTSTKVECLISVEIQITSIPPWAGLNSNCSSVKYFSLKVWGLPWRRRWWCFWPAEVVWRPEFPQSHAHPDQAKPLCGGIQTLDITERDESFSVLSRLNLCHSEYFSATYLVRCLTCKKEKDSILFSAGGLGPHGSHATVSLLWRNHNRTDSVWFDTAAGQEAPLHLC